MAQPRKPTETLELTGAFKKNPQRKRTSPKSSEPIGDPPQTLSIQSQACWHELVGLAAPGVMTGADRIALEILSVLLAQFREDPMEFGPPRLLRMEQLLAKFGMTPADRSRIHEAAEEKEENPFAGFH